MKMLMQGLSLPALTSCASSPLPPHRDVQPPPPPADPLVLEDTVGKAVVRGASFHPQARSQPTLPMDPVDEFNAGASENVGADVTVQTVSKSRTSEWRERKRQQVAAGNLGPTKKARKQYHCRVCGQVQSTG